MPLDLQLIDAFASGPFTGNPAAVVLLDHARPDAWMQNVAMEMNQAETAFLLWENGHWSLRWFTPLAEVALCGHATLASAHFLWGDGHWPMEEVLPFVTKSGVLTAARNEKGNITLDFPAIESHPIEPPAGLSEALGLMPDTVMMGDFDLLCVLDDATKVRAMVPNLAIVSEWNVRGLIVTAKGGGAGVDYISRCFFPRLGIAEDPVTGSAHCALVPYWAGILKRSHLVGYQASRRGGTLVCDLSEDRVRMSGKAVVTLRGQLEA